MKQSTPQKFKQSPKFAILTLNKEKYLKLCHTERSEVSIQKTENRLLNTKFGVDISPYKLCVTKRSVETKFVWIFAVVAPCKLLCRLFHKRLDTTKPIITRIEQSKICGKAQTKMTFKLARKNSLTLFFARNGDLIRF